MLFPKYSVALATTMAFGLVPAVRGAEDEQCVEDFWFWKLGHMDGPHVASKALGISRDGNTIVGKNLFIGTDHAFRVYVDYVLTNDLDGDTIPPLYNELQVQEDLGCVYPKEPSAAFASSDMLWTPVDYEKYEDGRNLDWGGSNVVGTQKVGKNHNAMQWLLGVLGVDSPEEGVEYLKVQDFGGGISGMTAFDVSIDGKFVVGTGNTRRGEKGFIYDRDVQDLNGVPIPMQLEIEDLVTGQTLKTSSAKAVSEDGATIAGTGSLGMRGDRAFVAKVPDTYIFDGLTPLELESTILPVADGGKFAEASGMTPDGAIIVGTTGTPQGPQACIWFKNEDELWEVKVLGALSHQPDKVDSHATGVAYTPGSPNGELLVIGYSTSNQDPSEAFVWTGNPVVEDDDIGYFLDLEYILTKTGTGEASGMGSDWVHKEATGISRDGTRIVGWGVNPEGGIEAWIITGYPTDIDIVTDCIEAR